MAPEPISRWALVLGLLVLFCHTLAAQQNHLSVALKAGPGCGAAIPASALQTDTETQLLDAGIGVSRVHAARSTPTSIAFR
jgi:hypothetical protein